jgi:hypothetical protein
MYAFYDPLIIDIKMLFWPILLVKSITCHWLTMQTTFGLIFNIILLNLGVWRMRRIATVEAVDDGPLRTAPLVNYSAPLLPEKNTGEQMAMGARGRMSR